MELKNLNKWWDNPALIESDKHIKDISKLKYVYHHELLDFSFKKQNIYTILGPRQVGKTTFLKLLIKKLLTNIPTKNIFYWSCDLLNSNQEILDLINNYSDYCDLHNASPDYIILDEITDIDNWQKAIKFIVDNNIVESCFILSGSNAIDLKKGSERLPGRKGKFGKDIFFMPLSFRQYVKLIDKKWYEQHKDSAKLQYESRKLNLLFEKYLITGGIPLVINEYENNKEIPNYIYELYYSWIIGDILKQGKNEQTLKEILKSILITYTTDINYNSLAKRSSVKSHVTISSYLELLENLFVTFNTYFYDISKKSPNFNKNKKIYFHDPFILNLFSKRFNINIEKSKIIEGIVGSKLKRKNLIEGIYFTKFKKETDFVIDYNKAIEVKYQSSISKQDFENKKYFNDFKIISKNIYDKKVIPAYDYLFRVGL